MLLDLRSGEEYKEWHIKEAINFPAVNISRDKTIPELFRFKNQVDKLIIIYMNDERQGVPQATLLTEKGYDNVFLLSGGCEAFLQDNADLCEGINVPESAKDKQRLLDQKALEKKEKRSQKHASVCMGMH